MYYPDIDLLHIHIPKTAGTSIKTMLDAGLKSKGGVHWTYQDYIDNGFVGPETKVFTVIRNPHERVVSFYHWIQSGGPDPNLHERVKKALDMNFDEFVDLFLEEFEPEHYFYEGGDIRFIHFDTLKDDLEAYFKEIDLDIKVNLPHVYKTKHDKWEAYYNKATFYKIYAYEMPTINIIGEYNLKPEITKHHNIIRRRRKMYIRRYR